MAGLGLVALLAYQSSTQAADHLDSDSLAANPLADINDVYAWMTTDKTKLNLVMSISPIDMGDRTLSPAVQYAFHVTSKSGLGVLVPGGTETQVICVFASNTDGECWVTEGATVKDYVKGDPSATAGMVSEDGKLRVFAGRRSDPFFFNLAGFNTAIAAAKGAAATLTFDAAGCPTGCGADTTCTATALALRNALKAPAGANGAPCAPGATDCFATLNIIGIAVQVDKTLVNAGANTALGVWGSSHAGS
jgi:hypothetical protein